SLRQNLEENTNETKEHCLRMKNLSLRFGQLLNLNDSRLEELGLLALLHDIGKRASRPSSSRRESLRFNSCPNLSDKFFILRQCSLVSLVFSSRFCLKD